MTAETLLTDAENELADRILNDLGDSEEDPEAPYGYTREGKPRGKPGPKPGAATSTSSGRARRTTRSRRHSPTRSSSPPKSKAPAGPDYAAGIRGVLQMIAAPLAMLGMKKPEWMLDAATITIHANPVSEGVAEAVPELPQLQAVLDRVMAVGPWGIALSPLLAMGVQMLANHGVIPAGQMGTLTRQELMAMMDQAHGAAA